MFQSWSEAGINHAVTNRQQGQLDIAADRKLFENSVTVGVYGFWRQAQFVGNDLDFLATDDHQGDLDFPLGQRIEG